MKLTPLDIRKQEFKRVLRGLDPEEVEAFLIMVADEFEVLIREKNQLNDELIKLRTQLRDYQKVETSLRDTLMKAQNTMEDSRANSKREAEIIIHEAELQADNIVKEAREELFSIRHEISLLKSQRDAISNRLRHLLKSQLEMLDVMETDEEQSRHHAPPQQAPTQRQQTQTGQRQPQQGSGERRVENVKIFKQQRQSNE